MDLDKKRANHERKVELGKRIRHRRDELGLTQPELAARMPPSVQFTTISNWEKGKHEPRDANLVALAEALAGDDRSAASILALFQEVSRVYAAPLPPTQIDRIELLLEALCAHAGLDVRTIIAAAEPTIRVIEAAGETLAQDEQSPADTPAREGERPAPGRSRPRRAGTEPA